MLLVGDIGGTNMRFGLVPDIANGMVSVTDFQNYNADEMETIANGIRCYIDHAGHEIKNASLVMAGPLRDGRISFTHRDWDVTESALSRETNIPSMRFFNDFAGMARAVPELSDDSFIEIKAGKALKHAPYLIAGPGTGFGVAVLTPISGNWHVTSCEGGHMAYPAVDRFESDVLEIIHRDLSHVSLQIICAGKGLPVLHKAVCTLYGQVFEPLTPSEMIARANAGDEICLRICKMRAMALLGAAADMALITGSRAGIILAGGVTKRLIDFINTPEALERFHDRWRDSDFLRDIPIRVLTNPVAPLIGAAALYMDKGA